MGLRQSEEWKKMQKRAKDTRRESEVGETSGGNREAGAEIGEAEAWAATGGEGRGGGGWTLGLPEVLVGDAKESEGDWPGGQGRMTLQPRGSRSGLRGDHALSRPHPRGDCWVPDTRGCSLARFSPENPAPVYHSERELCAQMGDF